MVSKTNRLKVHELSSCVPAMDGEDFANLKASMQKNGYLPGHPIVMFQGEIIDGQHRYKAAIETGVMPETIVFGGTYGQALDFIVAGNHDRRHLTKSQKAALIVQVNDRRRPEDQMSTRQIADKANVSTSVVRTQKDIRRADSALADDIASGNISTQSAKRKIGKRRTEKWNQLNISKKLWNQLVDCGAKLDLTPAAAGKLAIEEWVSSQAS